MDMDFDNIQLPSSLQMPAFIIIALDELWKIYENSTMKYTHYDDLVINGINIDCFKKSKSAENVTYGIGAYHIVLIFIFSLMVKRLSFKTDKCNGRPGLAIPMNMLNSHDYIIEYVLVFLSLSEEIFNLIFGFKETVGDMIPIAKFFVKLVLVVIISLFSYPIFAAICGRFLLWYVLVLLSSIANFCVGIVFSYTDSLCLVGTKMIPQIIVAVVCSSIDMSIICLFLWKFICHARLNGWNMKESQKRKDKIRHYSIKYVKELLKEKVEMKDHDQDEFQKDETGVKVVLKSIDCNELRVKIKDRIYRQIPGFSIPPRLMIGIFVGLYFAYRMFIRLIFDLTPFAWNLINNLNDVLPTTGMNLYTAFQLASGNLSSVNQTIVQNAFRHLTFFYARLLIACIIAAVFVGFINSIIQILMLLRNYRLHFHKLTRKGFSSMISIKQAPEPNGLILGFVRYSGYQASYLLWGIIIVIGFTLAFLFFIIGIFLLPCIYLENSWARRFVVNYGPVLLASIIFNFLQSLFVKHVLVKEHGKLMEIDNRRFFMIYTHCVFFLNAMMGLFNSVKRLIIWIFTGVFTFCRIDFSLLPEYLHGFDSGFMCYIGFLYTEQYHYNPILQCFSYILLDSNHKTECDQYKMEFKPEKTTSQARYRNLWHLALTLINNRKLLAERKSFLKSQIFQ